MLIIKQQLKERIMRSFLAALIPIVGLALASGTLAPQSDVISAAAQLSQLNPGFTPRASPMAVDILRLDLGAAPERPAHQGVTLLGTAPAGSCGLTPSAAPSSRELLGF